MPADEEEESQQAGTEGQVEPDVSDAQEVFEVRWPATHLVDGHPDHAAQEKTGDDRAQDHGQDRHAGLSQTDQTAKHPEGGRAQKHPADSLADRHDDRTTSIVNDQTPQWRLYRRQASPIARAER